MNHLKTKINNQFTISVADLTFLVKPNILAVFDSKGQSLVTEVRAEELELLEAFCNKAQEILAPMPGSSVVYQVTDGPQKVTLVKDDNDIYTLFINNQIQFTTEMEEKYHEALIHPAIAANEVNFSQRFLILGGGDGLAAKQIILNNPNAQITLVDFDKNITDLFTNDDVMGKFNGYVMQECKVINEDAFTYVDTDSNKYDVIVCDFPDPDDRMFNKLYSIEFYSKVKKLLDPNGSMVVQSGSVMGKNETYNCINKTLKSAGFKTLAYNTPTIYGDLCYYLCKLNTEPKVQFNRSFNTLDQNYFDKVMCTFRPGVINDEGVQINTVTNYAAYHYRRKELKLEESDEF